MNPLPGINDANNDVATESGEIKFFHTIKKFK